MLPSPLLPATAYSLLVDGLRAAGAEPSIADPSLDGSQGADDLVLRWASGIDRAELLVAHSNAGLLAPLVRAQRSSSVPIVFMDAALLPELGVAKLAPEGFRSHLAGLADERGILPPWTRWWPRGTLSAVVPDDLFDAIDRTCPRLPVHYFDHQVEAPFAWASGPNAYLAFGATYDAELDFARSRTWPTHRMDGGHLHFLHRPADVAERVLAMAREVREADG